MVGCIHTAIWVGIFMPSATDVVILLKDLEGDSRLLEPNGGHYSGDPATDNCHGKWCRRVS